MAVLEYIKPLEFTTGQILGRANLGVLRDNDDFFNAVADRYIPVPAGVSTKWHDTISYIIWDGWHLKRTDMDTLYYYATLLNDDVGHPTTLTGIYDYNDDFNDTTMFSRNTTGTSSGTVDLSAFPNGLYRVTFLMTRAGGDTAYDATATVAAPYTIYTGALSYAAADAIVDGNVSTAANFNKWRANDIYFDAITPSQIPAQGLYMESTLANQTLELFNGWDKWHPDHRSLVYWVWLDEFDADNVVIYYDADDVIGIQSTSIGADGDTVSTWAIPDVGYVQGDFYRVRVTLETSVNAGWRKARCYSLFMTAASLDATYTVMDPFTVDQFVYGDTAAQLSRLDYLTDNDASIYDRLTWGAAIPGRMDFACRNPFWHGSFGKWFHGDFRFRRRGDTLYYRTTGAELLLPSGATESLEDHDGTSGDYNTLDLNSINLPHGGYYRIQRVSHTTSDSLIKDGWYIDDETLDFAMEV